MNNNIVNVEYEANGNSTKLNNLGMREMQSRAFAARGAQYILIKAPPASGKSRALMYIALDKLNNGDVQKVIVAVPERSIGGSFKNTNLTSGGFYRDWVVNDRYNLCLPGTETSKVTLLGEFLDSNAEVLVCTHATLRFAFDKYGPEKFNGCLVGIDEFHHVSANYESKLGELIRSLMNSTDAHILAMTGSYFRGDGVPVLQPSDEARFKKVTYNYYEQLNGYTYLKSLGIGFHFYQGKYTSAINEVLDTDKKTILHIPNVNSGESTKDKYLEVDTILDNIGDVVGIEAESNILLVQRRTDGKIIRVADLVNDNPIERDKTITYLRSITKPEEVDLIIALGMAKEGFDWTFCEHALTVGYRGSLTEIIQIIGRCTRDSENKRHAQFTNLVAEPDADGDEVVESVNNILKAIAASLLMEQVLAPVFDFKSRDENVNYNRNTIKIDGFREPSSERVKNIVENDLTDLKANILQDSEMIKTFSGVVDAETINHVLLPKIIMERYPDLNEEQVEEVREHLVSDMVIRHSEIDLSGDRRLIKLADKFIDVDELNLDMIDSINPFQKAFEVISKELTPKALKAIQDCISAFKVNMTDDEAVHLWGKIQEFVRVTMREPSLDALDPKEKRLAEALAYLRQLKREQMNGDN